MCDTPESFIWLTGTAWTGLSAVATFAAVVVALFLPFFLEHRQRKNILVLIEKELDDNYSRLEKTETWVDQELNGLMISAVSLKIAAVEHIKLKIWGEFKYKLAVSNPDEYEKYKDINDTLEQISDYRNDCYSTDKVKKHVAINEIEREISSFIRKCKEACKLG